MRTHGRPTGAARRITIMAATAALALTACGGGDEDGSDASGDGAAEVTTIRVGTFLHGDITRAISFADELGYFEEVGLQVESVSGGNTPGEIVPLIAADEVDVAFLAHHTAVQLAEMDMDLALLREMNRIVPGHQQLWAGEASGITSLDEMAGASVGVIVLNDYGDMLLNEALATVGLGLDDVERVEIPPPSAAAALERGDVDVVWLSSHWAAALTMPDAPAATMLLDFADLHSTAGISLGGLQVRHEFADDRPAAVSAFIEVLDRVVVEMAEDPEADRDHLRTLLPQVPAELVDVMPLAEDGGLDPAGITAQFEMLVAAGVLDEVVDIEEFIWEGAR